MSGNRYQFEGHRALSCGELFLFIALDQTRTQLGFDDLAAVAVWLLGQNDVPIAGKMITATEGTSVLSIFFRNVITKRTATRLPTITWESVRMLRFAYTKSLGAFVGRWIPVGGMVLMGYDATVIMYRSVQRYNEMVRPEDRIG